MAFENLQGWRVYDLPGQPVLVFNQPHSEKVFPDLQREPPMFQFVPPVLPLGTRTCCTVQATGTLIALAEAEPVPNTAPEPTGYLGKKHIKAFTHE